MVRTRRAQCSMSTWLLIAILLERHSTVLTITQWLCPTLGATLHCLRTKYSDRSLFVCKAWTVPIRDRFGDRRTDLLSLRSTRMKVILNSGDQLWSVFLFLFYITKHARRRNEMTRKTRIDGINSNTFDIGLCHNGKGFWSLLRETSNRRSIRNHGWYPSVRRWWYVWHQRRERSWRNNSATTRERTMIEPSKRASYLTLMVDEACFISLMGGIDHIHRINREHITTDTLCNRDELLFDPLLLRMSNLSFIFYFTLICQARTNHFTGVFDHHLTFGQIHQCK